METPRARRHLPSRAAKVKTPNRLTRSTAAHFTSSSSDEVDLADDSEDELGGPSATSATRKRGPQHSLTPTPKKLRRNPTRGNNRPSRAQSGTGEASSRPSVSAQSKKTRKFAIGAPPKKRAEGDSGYKILPPPGVTVPWETLPYLVWLRVFDYLTFPLRDSSARPDDVAVSVRSLLSAARTCKIFTEPALAGLYKAPPLTTTGAHQLVARLNSTAPTLINYRPKVEILRIDVSSVLVFKIGGSYLSLKDLIQNLPRLAELELYHLFDLPPYRQLDDTIRWKYPDELFEALGPDPDHGRTTATELRSWRWSSRLAGPSCALELLPTIHASPSFVSLRKVAFVNYQLPSLTRKPSDEVRAMDELVTRQMGAAINALPHLEHLILESSTVANGDLLQLLPKNLKHLELINCWEVTAESFAAYLMSHGNSLLRLTLDHCQSLSLAFLPVLSAACPALTHLHMNFRYFRLHEFLKDDYPEYAAIIETFQVPTWPSSLQSIDLAHLRKWGSHDNPENHEDNLDAAEMFFQSLVDSAPNLPDLRWLSLKGTLNISNWRARASFRDKWAEKMRRVFLRKFVPPKTLRTVRSRVVIPVRSTEAAPKEEKPPTRRSTRIAEIPAAADDDAASMSPHKHSPAVPPQGLRRGRSNIKAHDADDEFDSDDDEPSGRRMGEGSGQMKDPEGLFIHGLCDWVDISIDNQVVKERQFGMEDFLDSEQESDSEWDGDDSDYL